MCVRHSPGDLLRIVRALPVAVEIGSACCAHLLALTSRSHRALITDDANIMISVAEAIEHDMGMEAKQENPLHENYLENIGEQLKLVTKELLHGDSDPPARADRFEIELRKALFEKITPLLSSSDLSTHSTALNDLGNLWVSILGICFHLAHFTIISSPTETPTANETIHADGQRYPDLLRRQVPILLLEDIVEVLPTELSVKFWIDYVEPSYDMMFSDTLWSAKNQACWLALVKVTVKLLSSNPPTQHSARLMQMVARVYPLSEKSGVKVWGSVNTENVVELESATFFETQQSDLAELDKSNLASEDGVVADYSFYESFWKLQQDFHNPNGIAVADFLRRLQTFFAALESHKPDTLADKGEMSRNTHKYLTSSRLLATQLRDTNFRIHILTQFLITAHHLTNQVESLTSRLAEHIIKAKRLLRNMGANAVYHLKIVESILESLEPQWRRWKQNKCKPDLDTPKQSISGHKRKQVDQISSENTDQENLQSDSHYSVLAVQKDLPNLSRKMRSVVPAVDSHLEDYVEALDPDSGIEAEYHPKNEALFSWRALRLLSEQHVGRQFEKIGPNGDFEVAIRHIYKEEKDLDIPGEAPVYNEVNLDEIYHSDNEHLAKDHVEEDEEDLKEAFTNSDQQMRDESEVDEDTDAANISSKDDYADDVENGDDDDDRAVSEAGADVSGPADEVPMDLDKADHGTEEKPANEDIDADNKGPSEGDKTEPPDKELADTAGQILTSRTDENNDQERPKSASEGRPAVVEKENETKHDEPAHRRSPPRGQTGAGNREHRRSPPRDQAGSDDRRDRRFDGGRRGDGSHGESRPGGRTDGPAQQGGQSFDGRRGMVEASKDTRGRGNPPPNRGGSRDHDRGRDSDRRVGARDHERSRHEHERGRIGPPSGRGDDAGRGPPPLARGDDTGRGPPPLTRGDDAGRGPPPHSRERRGDGDWNGDRRRGGRRR